MGENSLERDILNCYQFLLFDISPVNMYTTFIKEEKHLKVKKQQGGAKW